jgi:hypothetical protein
MSSTNRVHLVLSGGAVDDKPASRVEVNTVGTPEQQCKTIMQSARRRRGAPIVGLSLCVSAVLSFAPALARAQTTDMTAPAPAPAPPPPMPPPADTTMPPPPPPPPSTGGVTPAQSETPPLNTEAMPATRTETLPPISVGAWLRVGGSIQGSNPKNLDGERFDTIYGEIHAGGKIHKYVSLTLNLNAGAGTANSGGGVGLAGVAGIEDAIVGFEFADEFHLWLGQMLVPVDRANYGGPFFMIPWTYPGFLSVGGSTSVLAPKEGPNGRNGGATVWGDIANGKFKYALGAFQTGSAATSPLFSARLSAALLGSETGYFGNETYFGDKDIISVAVGGQYQKNGSTAPTPPAGAPPAPPADNYGEVNADALMELKYGGGGWVSLDGSYYHFVGDNQAFKDAFYVTGAIATPQVWVGNIQPMVRYQWGSGDSPLPKSWSVDAFVNYLVKGPALRIMLGFNHTELGNSAIGNAVQLGVQAIFF